jgi:hypothetical protein
MRQTSSFAALAAGLIMLAGCAKADEGANDSATAEASTELPADGSATSADGADVVLTTNATVPANDGTTVTVGEGGASIRSDDVDAAVKDGDVSATVRTDGN